MSLKIATMKAYQSAIEKVCFRHATSPLKSNVNKSFRRRCLGGFSASMSSTYLSKSSTFASTSEADVHRQREQEMMDSASRGFFFKDLLPCACACDTCMSALPFNSEKRPCWYDSQVVLAGMVMDALRSGIRHLKPSIRSASMSGFDKLTEEDRPEGMSDLMDFACITLKQLQDRLNKRSPGFSVDTHMLLDLARLALVCSWKCDRRTVEKVYEIETQGKKRPDAAAFQATLDAIRSTFQSIMRQTVRLALLDITDKASPQGLLSLIINYLNHLVHLFLPGMNMFPWVECLLYNFRLTFKAVWTFSSAPEKLKRETFVFPTKSKMGSGKAEMPVTLLPRVAKNATCDQCKTKLPITIDGYSSLLFPLEYLWTALPLSFPREVPLLDRPDSQRGKELRGDEGYRCSVGAVCGPACLLRAFASILPAVHRACKDAERALDIAKEEGTVSINGDPVRKIFDLVGDEFAQSLEEDTRRAVPSPAGLTRFLGGWAGAATPMGHDLEDALLHKVMEVYEETCDATQSVAAKTQSIEEISVELRDTLIRRRDVEKRKPSGQRVPEIKLVADVAREMIKKRKGGKAGKLTPEKEEETVIPTSDERGGEESLLQRPLHPYKDGPLLEYRKAIAKKSGRDSHVAKVDFRWKSAWGKVAFLDKFCKEDRSVSFNVSTRDSLRPLQPPGVEDEKKTVQKCFEEDGGVVAFIGVSNAFAPLRHHVEGIKCIASPASLEDSKNLREWFKDFDMMLFVKDFDLQRQSCRGGFVYNCKNSRGYVALVFPNMFDRLLFTFREANMNLIASLGAYASAGYEPKIDTSDEHPPCVGPGRVIFDFLLVAGKIFWQQAPDELKKQLKVQAIKIDYDMEECEAKFQMVTLLGFPPNNVMKAFARNLGKSPDDFTFTLKDGGSAYDADARKLDVSIAKVAVEGGLTTHVLDLVAKEKSPGTSDRRQPDRRRDEAPMPGMEVVGDDCRLTLEVHREGRAQQESTQMVVPQPMPFSKVLEMANISPPKQGGKAMPVLEFHPQGQVKWVDKMFPRETFTDFSNVSPSAIGDKYGFNPVSLKMTYREVSFEKKKKEAELSVKTAPKAEVTAKKEEEADAKPREENVKTPVFPQKKKKEQLAQNHDDKGRRRRRNFFEFSRVDTSLIRSGDAELVWRGRVKIVTYEDHRPVLDRYMWFSVWSKYNSAEAMNVLTTYPSFPYQWKGQLRGAVVEDPKFVDMVSRSKLLFRGVCTLEATPAPDWGRSDDGGGGGGGGVDAASVAAFADAERLIGDEDRNATVIPFIWRERLTFMMLRYSKEYKVFNLLVPLDLELAASLAEKLERISAFITCEGHKALAFGAKAQGRSFVRGVLADSLGREPFFAMTRTDVRGSGARDPLRYPQVGDDAAGCCAVVLMEERFFEAVLGPWVHAFEADLHEDPALPTAWNYLHRHFSKLHLLCFLPSGKMKASSATPREILAGLIEQKIEKNVTEIARSFVAIRLGGGGSSSVSGHILTPMEGGKLAVVLFERQSKLASMSVFSTDFSWDLALDMLGEEVAARDLEAVRKVRRELEDRPRGMERRKTDTALKKAAVKEDLSKQKATAKEEEEEEMEKPKEEPKKEEDSKPKKRKKKKFPPLSKTLTLGSFFGVDDSNYDGATARWRNTLESFQKKLDPPSEGELVALQSCTLCGREGFDMAACSLCGVTAYCGEKCLRDGWGTHRRDCREIRHNRTLDIIDKVVAAQSEFEKEAGKK